jgi:hypothetical protein
VQMNRTILGLGAAAVALFAVPSRAQAQVPVVLVCQDGTTQPGSSRVSCADHGGMDWDATRAWSEMRAGRFVQADTVVCIDGQARAAAKNPCEGHGGVDSVSTLAAVKRRAKAHRYLGAQDTTASQAATAAPRGKQPKTRADSLKWGYPVDKNPEVQNPPGYRGMERPVGVFPPDSSRNDSAASASATSRVNQMQRQDSLGSEADQNPPGYRGMERPVPADSAAGRDSTNAAAGRDSTEAAVGRDSTNAPS